MRAALSALLLAVPASAETDLDAAARLLSSATTPSGYLAALRLFEEAEAGLRLAQAEADRTASDATAAFVADDAALTRLFGVLARAEQNPPGFDPDGVLAGLVQDALVRQAAERVAVRRLALERRERLAAEVQGMSSDLLRAEAGVQAAREAIRASAPAGPDPGADPATLVALAIALSGGEAGDLAPPARAWGMPLSGEVLRPFSPEHPGVLIGAGVEALVAAPAAGQVLLSGELDSLGRVVILEVEQDLLIVFAGIGEAVVGSGMSVEAGAPLGFLGRARENVADIAQEGGFDPERGALYIEVRADGTPVDPASWFGYVR
ncbi:MAG: peptidoglycan DD-metalloendopeptidase family protein [Pseudomonadota bacterium]